jgi:hypothetical protein
VTKSPTNVAASIAARLRAQAKRDGRAYDELLTYFAIERFLFRLASTPHRDRFVLKGALMLPMWGSSVARATRDIDLLGRGEPSPAGIAAVIADCIAVPAPDDGLAFDATTIRATEIREQERYGGIRATFLCLLERSRISMQVDVGLGDAITPGVVEIVYPTILELPPPRLDAYPAETAIAEKLEAVVNLGLGNSRMKDFFDLWSLLGHLEIDGETITTAVRATFLRRGTTVPTDPPVGLTSEFSRDHEKLTQWSAFVRKLKLHRPDLEDVVHRISTFGTAVFDGTAVAHRWFPGRGWA